MGLVALIVGVITLAVLSTYVANRALIAKDALTAAQAQLTGFKSALGQPDAPSTTTLYLQVQSNTAKAARQLDDPVWEAYEGVPVIGPNLKAFRQTADLVNTLVRDGVGPLAKAADGISVNSLKPQNGVVNIEPIKKLTPAMGAIDTAITAADVSARAIDTTHLARQVRGPIVKLQGMLAQAAPVTHELRSVMPVLYPALGGDGARHYLLMFQNNAEERASGGNPASMALLVVDHGKISLSTQGNSGQFPTPYRYPVYTPTGPGEHDWSKIYTNYASTFVTNITMTPDFPTTAKLARAMWRGRFGGKVDGVVSFDPVALSYLLNATGPITLGNGQVVSSGNIVEYLLHTVYDQTGEAVAHGLLAQSQVKPVQDAVFSSAAQSVFHAVTHGQGDPKAYIAQLAPMLADQRLKVWSDRPAEERLLINSPVGNMLPPNNTSATVLGVYNNDDATSKMSYFMDEQVHITADTCTATPRFTVAARVTDTLPPSAASSLPPYVRANQPRIVPGGDRQWVQLFGPVGAKLVTASIDGKKVIWGTNLRKNTNRAATGVADFRPAVDGDMYGRPVGVVSIKMGPSQSVTVEAAFSGGTAVSKTIELSHTPKVHPVPVEVSSMRCS